MQRLLKEKREKRPEASESITLLEEKLVDFSLYLSEIQDDGLRRLLDFLFNYVVAKPNTTPRTRTIVKHFHLEAGSEALSADIRRVLYAVRLMSEISTEKQRIEKVYGV
ncbi:MAG: hypothetical protein JSW53_03695 [Candidatus Bathyarchaeota archaeon]|nr:MAG: hypothetical protein JSW53_03695 [Candidatus Bathyarchaeota archaeon]